MLRTNKRLTRVELSEAVYKKVRLSRVESSAFVEIVLKEITSCLQKGEPVKLASFGTFLVRNKSQRIGRNPKTREPYLISERRVVVFKPSAILKRRVSMRASVHPAKTPVSQTKARQIGEPPLQPVGTTDDF